MVLNIYLLVFCHMLKVLQSFSLFLNLVSIHSRRTTPVYESPSSMSALNGVSTMHRPSISYLVDFSNFFKQISSSNLAVTISQGKLQPMWVCLVLFCLILQPILLLMQELHCVLCCDDCWCCIFYTSYCEYKFPLILKRTPVASFIVLVIFISFIRGCAFKTSALGYNITWYFAENALLKWFPRVVDV